MNVKLFETTKSDISGYHLLSFFPFEDGADFNKCQAY